MKKFFASLREHSKNIVDFEKIKMLLLTKEGLKSHHVKVRYICRKRILKKFANNKNYQKVRDHCRYKGKYNVKAQSICNLKFNVPNEIPVIFYNGSNYDYHFINKELANKFDKQFECLVENKEKCKTFFVLIKKEVTKINKNGYENVATISYKIKLNDICGKFIIKSC